MDRLGTIKNLFSHRNKDYDWNASESKEMQRWIRWTNEWSTELVQVAAQEAIKENKYLTIDDIYIWCRRLCKQGKGSESDMQHAWELDHAEEFFWKGAETDAEHE